MPESGREVLFLTGDPAKARNDNHLRLPAAFESAGWKVSRLDHQQVRVCANEVRIGERDPAEFTLIWPLGFGRQASFFDRMQMLKNLPQDRFVVAVDALVYLHGKHRWLRHMPETHTSSSADELLTVIRSGGEWVLKPTAGSYGRDVVRISDPAQGQRALQHLQAQHPDAHLMLQRFLPAIANGEKRSLVAGGEIVGSYLRRPRGDFRANLALDADAEPTRLSAAESALVGAIADELAGLGAGFAAIDTVYPHLIEVNVANPGGLATLESLGEPDVAAAAVAAICRWKNIS